VTAALAQSGFTIEASDAHGALISMWTAAAKGWRPVGQDITREEWAAAKTLPDTDPMKAFVGFACAFGAKYFSSPAIGLNSTGLLTYFQLGRNLIRDKVRSFDGRASFQHRSFFDIEPRGGVILYCDPPYANVTGYGGTDKFDTAKFWDRCIDWYEAGADVLVSEYVAPDDVRCVLEQHRPVRVGAGVSAACYSVRVERLYSLDPDATVKGKPRLNAWLERDV
jgi:DNA adenine methylase